MGNVPKLELLRADGSKLPDTIKVEASDLTGSVNYLKAYVNSTLKLTPGESQLIEPGFKTHENTLKHKAEEWNGIFLHVLEELSRRGIELENREALLNRLRRDGRTLLYRRELGEEKLLATLREEQRGNGFGIEMVDHDRFKHYNDTFGHELGDLVLSTTGRLFRMHREGDIGIRWGGDEYLRLVLGLSVETQLGMVAGRDYELVETFGWESLDERFGLHLPRISIGLVYCEKPSQAERDLMAEADSASRLKPEEWFDVSAPVPVGSTYDLARKLVALADKKMYEAKHIFADTEDLHITQVNVRILNGELVEY